MAKITLYTDGGAHGNPGAGAWAFCLVEAAGGEPRCRSGYERHTTNNRMELTAVIEGLRALGGGTPESGADQTVEVCTDSTYVQKGITEWIHRWKKNGWQTSARKAVKNADLWRALDEVSANLNTTWRWVKGHAGNDYNELCDAMVQQTIAAGQSL